MQRRGLREGGYIWRTTAVRVRKKARAQNPSAYRLGIRLMRFMSMLSFILSSARVIHGSPLPVPGSKLGRQRVYVPLHAQTNDVNVQAELTRQRMDETRLARPGHAMQEITASVRNTAFSIPLFIQSLFSRPDSQVKESSTK